MKKTIILLAILAAAAGAFLLLEDEQGTAPLITWDISGMSSPRAAKKLECRIDLDCAVKVTDCTCGGPIYSCVSAGYPALECRNESFTCPNKQNPLPDHCGCENNACIARSCTGMCGDWKKTGYAQVPGNVEMLKEANCCSTAEGCMDLCAGGPRFTEADLDCIAVSSPQDYARQRCKGYVSNGSALESRLPIRPQKESKTFSVSCFYAGERVLGGYAFSYAGKFCGLNQAGMGFLFSPVGAEEALDYYLFSTRNISEKKEERQYEVIDDFGAFAANRTGCNVTGQPYVNRTTLRAISGGFNLSVIEYLPLKRQAVYEQASVYWNGNIERAVYVISTC